MYFTVACHSTLCPSPTRSRTLPHAFAATLPPTLIFGFPAYSVSLNFQAYYVRQTHHFCDLSNSNKTGSCTYNLPLRRVRVTVVAVENHRVLHILCVCSLSSTECRAHAPYYIVMCGLCGSTILFPQYFISGTIFGKKLLNNKCVFLFSVQLLSETFLILRRILRDIGINVLRSLCKVPIIILVGF